MKITDYVEKTLPALDNELERASDLPAVRLDELKTAARIIWIMTVHVDELKGRKDLKIHALKTMTRADYLWERNLITVEI
ncbi:MAG: hypothetical protein J6P89_01490 [Oscillospiraceae bacterium]|nr:hypothetical protein [Oscillospiraceae bacterium]